MNDQFLTELQNVMGGSGIFMEEPMKKHTTFRVGGPADVLVQPDETALVAILALCRQYHVSYSFIGNGSNLLVGDKGIRGVVIEMTDPMGNIEVDGTKITAQAGAMLSKIANTAASNGLGKGCQGGNGAWPFRDGICCRYSGKCRRSSCHERRSLWRRDEGHH